MRKSFLFPTLTGVFALLGFLLRQLQLRTGFDAAGLPISGALIHLAVPLCSAAYLILAALTLAGLRGKAAPVGYDEAFRCENNAGYMTTTVLSAVLLIGAFPLSCLAYVHRQLPNLLHLILSLLMAASGCCLVLLGRSNYRALRQGRYSGCLLLPAYTSALWLILSYQQVSGDPVLQNYIYRLLAIIFILLVFYFMAGFSFEKGRPLLTLFTCGGAVYFSLLCLADDRDWISIACLAGLLLYFSVHGIVLSHHLTVEREESTDE